MENTRSSDVRNRILLAMPSPVLERLRPHLKRFTLSTGQAIDHVDGPIEDMYFVDSGLVSIIKAMRDGRVVEVGAVGIEGVTDPNALVGMERAVLETVVQIPGTAFCIKRELLVREMEKSHTFRALMQSYARFAFGQLAQTAACNRLHTIEQRCCRWLLTAHDNGGSDTFGLTHEFLATMLGVQRTGVSIVANYLRNAGLIEYARGRVKIMDRQGLEDMTCECYADTRSGIDFLVHKSD